MKTFFNTIGERGKELMESKAKALSQQEIILNFFMSNPCEYYTPFDIQRMVLNNAPITSIRRAMTNLTNAGYLDKTTKMVNEEYGKTNHCWTLRKAQYEFFFHVTATR